MTSRAENRLTRIGITNKLEACTWSISPNASSGAILIPPFPKPSLRAKTAQLQKHKRRRTESRATVSVDGDSGPRERKSGGLGESGERESEGRQIRREWREWRSGVTECIFRVWGTCAFYSGTSQTQPFWLRELRRNSSQFLISHFLVQENMMDCDEFLAISNSATDSSQF